MSWVDALKEFAKETGKFSLPKKDSEDYAKVKAIQARLGKQSEAPAAPVKKERKAKVANVPVVAPNAAPVAEPAVAIAAAPVKKGRKAKVANVPVVVPVEVAPVAAPVKKVRVPRSVKQPNSIALPDPPVEPVESGPVKVPRKRTVVRVANPAPAVPEAPVRRGPTLVDRGVRIENRDIIMSFD